MSDVVSLSSEGGGTSDGYEALASLNEGFLGTGYSTSVELSLIAMVLIFGYVAITTFRYLWPEAKVLKSVVQALGLGDD